MTSKQRIGGCVTLAAALSFLAGHARAQQCSAQTTRGTYVVVASGYLPAPPPAAPALVPAKLLATARADDNGHFNGSGTLMLGGGPALTQTVDGTESINADCTGTITYTTTIDGQPGPNLDFTFVVSQKGSRIDGLGTDKGSVFAAVLTRISRKHEDGDADISRSAPAKPATVPVRLQLKGLPQESAITAATTVGSVRASGLSATRRSE